MIVRWGLLLVVTTVMMARAQDSSPSNVLSAKRGPVGFQGIRGKKNLASLEHDEFSKRSPMGFQGMRGKKASITAPVENQLVPKDTNNRHASMDKKDNPMPDLVDSYFAGGEYENSFPPMAFQSIRGKKAPSGNEYYKRAPMGFQGMRGKKSVEESNIINHMNEYYIDAKQILDEIEKRATMGLQGAANGAMGKDTYSFDYSNDYRGARDRNEEIPRELEKRAPMGFQGMRGKKAILDAIEELEKRAIMGFHGMRGKKDTFDNYVDYSIDPSDYEKGGGTDFQDPEGSELFKRSRIGFHGMRGKRDVAQPYGSNIARTTISGYQGAAKREHQLTAYEIGKRSPFRYLEARGKKNPRWEFRGKFVGVRDTFGGGIAAFIATNIINNQQQQHRSMYKASFFL